MQTSFLTPPFGFALFYLRGVAPAIVSTLSIYKGVIPFIIMQLLVLAFVAFTPRLVNYLPQRVSLTAATAPPPINPKLQVCIEDYVTEQFKVRGAAIQAAIARARQLDLSSLPEDLRKDVSDSFAKAEGGFGLLGKVQESERTIDQAAVTYAPLHRGVRDVQADMRRHDAEIAELGQTLRRTSDDGEVARRRKQTLEAQIATLQSERKALEGSIPTNWQAENNKFRRLLLDDRRARLLYRRNADNAYEPIDKATDIIGAADKLAALKPELESLRGIIDSQTPERAAESVRTVTAKVNDIPGADRVGSDLSKARRALRAREPDKAEAQTSLTAALQAFEADVAWRRRAAQAVLPGLRAYEQAIRDTIGLRKQERIPSNVAIAISGCMAQHRDISLHF
jgi:chromosome segregation ATPase